LENWRLERERDSGDFDGTVRVPCAKGRRRNATSQKQVGAPSCHLPQEVQQNSAKASGSRW